MAKRRRIPVNQVLNLKKPPKTLAGWVVTIVILAVLLIWQGLPKSENLTAPQDTPIAEGIHEVADCVDGDTIKLVDKTRIRLIGADTPETVKPNTPVQPFGPEASQYTKEKITQAGNRVKITFDGDTVDRYGRVLAMVWLDDLLLNEDLIRQGLARAQTQYNYSREMKSRFQQAENEAKAAKRGIWSLEP